MNTRLARWLRLESGDRWRLIGLMLALPAVSVLLRVAGAVRTRRLLERLSIHAAPRQATDEELQSAQRLAVLADVAGRRGVVSATCLRQSLLVYCLLRRRGLEPTLMLGVRKTKSAFDAHAWVRLQEVDLGHDPAGHAAFPVRDWQLARSR